MKAFTIGSDSNCNLVIKDKTVSGVHCELEKLDDTSIAIKDLDSSNGTFVNGRRIRRTILSESDELQLGNKSLVGLDVINSFSSYYLEHK